MKLIHCSDLHLCSPHTSLPADKANLRKQEILYTFDRLCDYAASNNVTAVILAGDTFDVRKITKTAKERFLNAIKKCAGVDFLYLPGNHDDAVLFDDLSVIPSNLKLFGEQWTSYVYDNVNVQGVILNQLNSKTVYATLKTDINQFNLVVMHGQVAGYKTDSEAEIISIPSLKNKNIDYLALGHYHSYSVGKIDDRGNYVYSGCLEGRGFDETGKKGFVLIDIGATKINHKFIPFASRELVEQEFVIDPKIDWYSNREVLLDTLAKIDCNSLVKIVLKGSHPIDYNIDKNELVYKLNQIFFYAKVYDKTYISVGEDEYLSDRSIKGEFIRLVMASDLDEQLKSKVILCGLNAIAGEELI